MPDGTRSSPRRAARRSAASRAASSSGVTPESLDGAPPPRGSATRTRLLRAAERLFTRHGYESTSMVDIARAAGVGVGTVYHHVRDKRALLLELVDRALERALERRSDPVHAQLLDGDPHEAITHWLRGSYERLREHPTLGLLLLAQSAADPELRLRKERIDALRVERFAALVALGQERGVFRRALDPAGAAFVAHHAMEAAALQLLVHRVRIPGPETILSELASMLGRYLVEDRGGNELGDR